MKLKLLLFLLLIIPVSYANFEFYELNHNLLRDFDYNLGENNGLYGPVTNITSEYCYETNSNNCNISMEVFENQNSNVRTDIEEIEDYWKSYKVDTTTFRTSIPRNISINLHSVLNTKNYFGFENYENEEYLDQSIQSLINNWKDDMIFKYSTLDGEVESYIDEVFTSYLKKSPKLLQEQINENRYETNDAYKHCMTIYAQNSCSNYYSTGERISCSEEQSLHQENKEECYSVCSALYDSDDLNEVEYDDCNNLCVISYKDNYDENSCLIEGSFLNYINDFRFSQSYEDERLIFDIEDWKDLDDDIPNIENIEDLDSIKEDKFNALFYIEAFNFFKTIVTTRNLNSSYFDNFESEYYQQLDDSYFIYNNTILFSNTEEHNLKITQKSFIEGMLLGSDLLGDILRIRNISEDEFLYTLENKSMPRYTNDLDIVTEILNLTLNISNSDFRMYCVNSNETCFNISYNEEFQFWEYKNESILQLDEDYNQQVLLNDEFIHIKKYSNSADFYLNNNLTSYNTNVDTNIGTLLNSSNFTNLNFKGYMPSRSWYLKDTSIFENSINSPNLEDSGFHFFNNSISNLTNRWSYYQIGKHNRGNFSYNYYFDFSEIDRTIFRYNNTLHNTNITDLSNYTYNLSDSKTFFLNNTNNYTEIVTNAELNETLKGFLVDWEEIMYMKIGSEERKLYSYNGSILDDIDYHLQVNLDPPSANREYKFWERKVAGRERTVSCGEDCERTVCRGSYSDTDEGEVDTFKPSDDTTFTRTEDFDIFKEVVNTPDDADADWEGDCDRRRSDSDENYYDNFRYEMTDEQKEFYSCEGTAQRLGIEYSRCNTYARVEYGSLAGNDRNGRYLTDIDVYFNYEYYRWEVPVDGVHTITKVDIAPINDTRTTRNITYFGNVTFDFHTYPLLFDAMNSGLFKDTFYTVGNFDLPIFLYYLFSPTELEYLEPLLDFREYPIKSLYGLTKGQFEIPEQKLSFFAYLNGDNRFFLSIPNLFNHFKTQEDKTHIIPNHNLYVYSKSNQDSSYFLNYNLNLYNPPEDFGRDSEGYYSVNRASTVDFDTKYLDEFERWNMSVNSVMYGFIDNDIERRNNAFHKYYILSVLEDEKNRKNQMYNIDNQIALDTIYDSSIDVDKLKQVPNGIAGRLSYSEDYNKILINNEYKDDFTSYNMELHNGLQKPNLFLYDVINFYPFEYDTKDVTQSRQSIGFEIDFKLLDYYDLNVTCRVNGKNFVVYEHEERKGRIERSFTTFLDIFEVDTSEFLESVVMEEGRVIYVRMKEDVQQCRVEYFPSQQLILDESNYFHSNTLPINSQLDLDFTKVKDKEERVIEIMEFLNLNSSNQNLTQEMIELVDLVDNNPDLLHMVFFNAELGLNKILHGNKSKEGDFVIGQEYFELNFKQQSLLTAYQEYFTRAVLQSKDTFNNQEGMNSVLYVESENVDTDTDTCDGFWSCTKDIFNSIVDGVQSFYTTYADSLDGIEVKNDEYDFAKWKFKSIPKPFQSELLFNSEIDNHQTNGERSAYKYWYGVYPDPDTGAETSSTIFDPTLLGYAPDYQLNADKNNDCPIQREQDSQSLYINPLSYGSHIQYLESSHCEVTSSKDVLKDLQPHAGDIVDLTQSEDSSINYYNFHLEHNDFMPEYGTKNKTHQLLYLYFLTDALDKGDIEEVDKYSSIAFMTQFKFNEYHLTFINVENRIFSDLKDFVPIVISVITIVMLLQAIFVYLRIRKFGFNRRIFFDEYTKDLPKLRDIVRWLRKMW